MKRNSVIPTFLATNLPGKLLMPAALLLVGALGVWLVHAAVLDNEMVPIDQQVLIDCDNDGTLEDVLDLQGDLHILLTSTTDKQGGVHASWSFQPAGVWAVGEITGDTYRAVGLTRQSTSVSASGDHFAATYVDNFYIIGEQSGLKYKIHVTTHMTVVNGEVVVNFDNTTTTCE